MKRKKRFLIICVTMLLLLIGAFIFYFGRGGDDNKTLLPIDELAETWKGKQDLLSTGETREIILDGFKTLVFRANTKNQKVNFQNNEENNCLIKMTLYSDDVKIWESGYVEPGKGYYNIELLEKLNSGEHVGKLQYQCCKDDGTQLNGAVVNFTLIVKE